MEAKSPGFVTPKRPALSVSARKIKDNAADWHNLILKWDSLNDSGFNIANKIVNMKMNSQFRNGKLEIECDSSTAQSGSICSDNEELQQGCTELLHTLEKMEKIQMKMEKLSSTVKGICDLETYLHGSVHKTILFHTWPVTYFSPLLPIPRRIFSCVNSCPFYPTQLRDEISLKMSEMYRQEWLLKETIVQELAHSTDQDLMMVYLSAWLHQPYLEDSIRVLLESMLLETGHRPL
ncbi:cyclin-dependent kinase 2-interacting protein isoform X1 [Rhinatrema bivittatum]|uniref:cyclin-dependent kinase 2-interacting protein isoform X1 n=1 Tax=Rhinatrema bivittatum TaxID=194408 RepID=UPI001129B8CB|nr:cyclin-dependent kinase 2-interacting protein isoform X1 [Rhinatrema bivittatum]XP_029453836.1 cyclin-dependent kinase 2-interacting protein isoform X1 [Rhinatrema bivittatum]XP_029453837.1 cyclin-dependent kinase 2-interacting protein isoform X1 [Rhinatrema bivittatum]XP_029453838.1 cyclin-dependent kinase 2-interacting protein isoform X1 [Rhinatrema bivittatum]XP_029453839.1 cyclin-dependent kinase 2-interacting protein isoform X1 [Rhinatrema bivittatum]XP_029453840.1 cyclin-dependent kin